LVVMDIQLTRLEKSFFYPREIRKTDTDIQIIITTTPDDSYWNYISDKLGKRDFILFQNIPYKPIELQQNAMVLYDKWLTTKFRDKRLKEVNQAYDLMAIEKMKADQENTAKGDFLANMSHEIRTPLNILLGIHEVLQGTDLDEDQEKYVEIANRSGEQLLHLINTLLNLSKIDAGKETNEPSEFSSLQFFEELFQLLSFKAEFNSAIFKTEVSDEIPEYIIADKEKLKIIMLNLIDNAIKFSKGGEVKVNLSKESNAIKNNIYIKLKVEDTGIGIQEDDLQNIFKNFYQVKANAANGYKGTGLGLSLTNKYVSILNGEITVKSKVGQGSVFEVILPVGLGEKKDVPKTDSNKPTTQKLSKNLRVLLVEDNEDNIQLMQIYLKNENCSFEVAQNGQTALEMFQKDAYDLILMDIEMPIMDGIEATKAIRKIERESGKERTPVIALTAFSRNKEIEICKAVGCDEVLKKPLKKATFLAFLQEFIDSGNVTQK
jgi:two-component system, sensor histidine kinase